MRRSDDSGYREYVTARMEVLRRTAHLLRHDWHLADDLVAITLGELYRHWRRAEHPRGTPHGPFAFYHVSSEAVLDESGGCSGGEDCFSARATTASTGVRGNVSAGPGRPARSS